VGFRVWLLTFSIAFTSAEETYVLRGRIVSRSLEADRDLRFVPRRSPGVSRRFPTTERKLFSDQQRNAQRGRDPVAWRTASESSPMSLSPSLRRRRAGTSPRARGPGFRRLR
jgi:hypothetical protein